MTHRRTAYVFAAALVMSVSFAVTANAATTQRHATHHARAGVHHSNKARAAAPRDSGRAATDMLNQQSLDAARGGASR